MVRFRQYDSKEDGMTYNYQVSVSKDGKFVFRTDTSYSDMAIVPVVELLFSKFPISEGFKLTVNKFPAQYESVEITEKGIKRIGYRPTNSKKEKHND